jgi:hypothetical protein
MLAFRWMVFPHWEADCDVGSRDLLSGKVGDLESGSIQLNFMFRL